MYFYKIINSQLTKIWQYICLACTAETHRQYTDSLFSTQTNGKCSRCGCGHTQRHWHSRVYSSNLRFNFTVKVSRSSKVNSFPPKQGNIFSVSRGLTLLKTYVQTHQNCMMNQVHSSAYSRLNLPLHLQEFLHHGAAIASKIKKNIECALLRHRPHSLRVHVCLGNEAKICGLTFATKAEVGYQSLIYA